LIKEKYSLKNNDSHKLLPNIFNEIDNTNDCAYKGKFILFYGMLNSTVNETAYKFLIDEIYPLIEKELTKKNIKILVIGKNKTKTYNSSLKNIKVIGEVDDLASYIKSSEFVFLPLCIASGTLTRILEVSLFKKPVLTTTIGAEGLNMDEHLFIEDGAINLASKIINLLKNKLQYETIAKGAYTHVKQNHSRVQVSKVLYSIIDTLKSKRLNIVHIPRRFTKSHWGGTENVIISYAKGLQKYNINSEVYTTKILNSQNIEYIEGIKVNRFSYFYPYLNLKNKIKEKFDLVGGNIFSFTMLFSLLFKKDIDLIHLHTSKRLGGIARFICKIRNIPYLISIHGGIYNRKPINNKEKDLDKSIEWGKVLGLLVGSRRVIQDSNTVICLNQEEYTKMKNNLPNNNILLLPNSVDVSNFSKQKNNNLRKKYNISKDKFICLISGRIDKQKNQMLMLEALNNIKNEYKNIHILLVGNITDNNYFNEIKAYIKREQLEDYVTIITDIKPESKELVDVYLNSDILVLPSIHEPFGIVVLEAWASSLPVLVTQAAGICNIIQNNKDAIIFKNNDLDSLQKKLLLLIKSKKLQYSLVQNAKELVANFDTNIISSKMNTIYRQLICNNS
jgi:glycosyltransferase involved in cell wall biosynthesis